MYLKQSFLLPCTYTKLQINHTIHQIKKTRQQPDQSLFKADIQPIKANQNYKSEKLKHKIHKNTKYFFFCLKFEIEK